MKTSISEHILEPAKRVRLGAFRYSANGFRSFITGLLILALSWSLVLPLSARAERRAISPPPAAPASPAAPSLTQASETFTVYGPHRFTRNTGQPVNVVENFSIPADAIAPFTILVENGAPGGSNRVSSATIKLNGTDLYSPNNFNQNVASLT